MSMFKGFSNAFKIPELRKKILITLGLVAVCRLVSFIPLPGVNTAAIANALNAFMANASTTSAADAIYNFLETATGGATAQCAIGVLSIWPYISASIVIQLLTSVIPYLGNLRKEGESGRQKISQITRYLTIAICVVQSAFIGVALMSNPGSIHPAFAGSQIVNPGAAGVGFVIMTVLTITTSSLLVMWIADQITTFGIGNGGSLIIMINITSRLPDAIISAWEQYFGHTVQSQRNPVELILLLIFGFLVVMGTVMLTQGVRKVAIHATRRAMGGGNSFGMQQTFMPLRVNYTGVMPIIFAGPLIVAFAFLLKLAPENHGMVLAAIHNFGVKLADSLTWQHLIVYAVMIMFFAFFWVATQFNAVEISENLKKDGSYVPGIRPGLATAEYLDALMTRITLIGGCGLLIIALLPQILMGWMNINWNIASFFGGTSLLIIVGVALDTLRIMESHLLVRKYDGFLRHGTLRGRHG